MGEEASDTAVGTGGRRGDMEGSNEKGDMECENEGEAVGQGGKEVKNVFCIDWSRWRVRRVKGVWQGVDPGEQR